MDQYNWLEAQRALLQEKLDTAWQSHPDYDRKAHPNHPMIPRLPHQRTFPETPRSITPACVVGSKGYYQVPRRPGLLHRIGEWLFNKLL